MSAIESQDCPPYYNSLSLGRVVGNSFWSLAGWVGALLLGFVISPIQIYLLGETHYGLMALLNSLIAPMILLDFGIGEATVKYVAESLGAGDYCRVEKYIRNTLAFNLIVGILGALVIGLLANILATRVFNIPPESQTLARQCLYWIGATWLIRQTRQAFIGAITALQRYDLLNIGTLLTQTLIAVVGVGVLALGGGLLEFTQVQAAASALATLGWLIVARRLFPTLRFTPTIDRGAFRQTFGYGFWQMLNYMGGILAGQSQRWLLGILLPVATVGFYNIGLQLNVIVYMITYRVGQVLFPAVSQLQGQGQEERAACLSLQASWMVSSLAVAAFVPVAVFAPDVLSLWISPSFAAQAASVTRILSLAAAVGAMFAVPSFYLLGTGRVKWLAALAFAQGLISLAGAALLIPWLGVEGAGWGYALGTFSHLTVLGLIWPKIFRRWISGRVYYAAVFGQSVTGLILAVALIYLRENIHLTVNWFWLAGECAASATLSLLVIVAVDSLLPGGAERRALLRRFGAYIGMQILRFRKARILFTE
jgi:O-antigen/teichoic acid export membrane protein